MSPVNQLDRDQMARLGDEVYANRVKPLLRPEDDGRFVAIDVATGDFEVDQDDYAAVARLRARRPRADVWLERAGYPAAYWLRSPR